LSWPIAPKLRLVEGDEVQTFGKRWFFKDLHFRTTKECKNNCLSLISLFEHKWDNNFGTEGVQAYLSSML
jgi:hypothetical protein